MRFVPLINPHTACLLKKDYCACMIRERARFVAAAAMRLGSAKSESEVGEEHAEHKQGEGKEKQRRRKRRLLRSAGWQQIQLDGWIRRREEEKKHRRKGGREREFPRLDDGIGRHLSDTALAVKQKRTQREQTALGEQRAKKASRSMHIRNSCCSGREGTHVRVCALTLSRAQGGCNLPLPKTVPSYS